MNQFLLDTHALLWLVQGSDQLPVSTLALIEDVDSDLYVSVASIWEAAIKQSLGKLQLKIALPDIVDALQTSEITILPVTADLALRVADLPIRVHHKDPFDRLLIAQAMMMNMPIISSDRQLDDYDVMRIW